MWWEPINADEDRLAEALRALGGWFRERRSVEGQTAWGFGSVLVGDGSPGVPLLLVGPGFPALYRTFPRNMLPFHPYWYPYPDRYPYQYASFFKRFAAN